MEKSSSTMQLTRAADYGIRVMIHLATLPARERALLPALARATIAPQSFLSKVLQALCHAGFIASRRGQAGGFELLPAGRKASLSTVIEAIEGPINLNLCLHLRIYLQAEILLPGAHCLGQCPGCHAGGSEHGNRRRAGPSVGRPAATGLARQVQTCLRRCHLALTPATASPP